MRRLLDSPWLYFGLAAVLAVAAIASQFRLGPPPKPTGTVDDIVALAERDDLNVVFILIDALRADHLSAYGYERPTSPRIDALAQRGIRFANVESQSSWTKTSMASLWTSLYPQRNGIHRYGDGLPDAVVMPAERFKEAGFATAGIYRNSWVSPNFGFGQGFDRYVKPAPNFDAERMAERNPSADKLRGSDIDATQSASEFIAANRDGRFFLYLHYMDVHQYSYDTESDLFGSDFGDMYDNAIHWFDINVDRVMETLRLAGIADRTVVVIAADHGEAFFEHGGEGHAKGLYNEVQRTPWMIFLPFDLPEPIVVDTHVANVDVFPTIFDLVGLPPLEDVDGVSALPLILAAGRGEAPPRDLTDRPLFAQIDRNWGKTKVGPAPNVSMLRPPYRMHRLLNEPSEDELFDHSTDPTEQKNLVRKQPEVAEAMSAEIDEFIETGQPAWEVSPVELDRMKLNQLRALGYKIER